ncbi:hypothetical protein ABTK92_20100, partial [Acinetobacter baumannii]
ISSWLPTLFPVEVRYTGISVAFNLGGIIGGALAPFIANWLAGVAGTASVGLFLTLAGALTFAGGRYAPRQPD